VERVAINNLRIIAAKMIESLWNDGGVCVLIKKPERRQPVHMLRRPAIRPDDIINLSGEGRGGM